MAWASWLMSRGRLGFLDRSGMGRSWQVAYLETRGYLVDIIMLERISKARANLSVRIFKLTHYPRGRLAIALFIGGVGLSLYDMHTLVLPVARLPCG